MGPHKSFHVLGELVDILVPGKDTEGRSTTLTQLSPPGGGPPAHSHQREDETFHVLEGEFEFLMNGEWSRLPAGATAHAARGSVHTFRNAGTTPARMLVFITPAGMEKYLEEISALAMPGDLPELLSISERYGISFPGLQAPPSA